MSQVDGFFLGVSAQLLAVAAPCTIKMIPLGLLEWNEDTEHRNDISENHPLWHLGHLCSIGCAHPLFYTPHNAQVGEELRN
jgi:hypothetical protein